MAFTIRPGGTGLQADADLVAAELSRVPDAVAAELSRRGIDIVACRHAVTDFAPELGDPSEVPEGWPAGSSWTNIPGAYVPARRAIVIATLGPDAQGPRRVPRRGEGHGARSLAVHETVHGYDYAAQTLKSADPAFRAAWRRDLSVLGDPYFTGETWGPRESFAESAAKVFGRDQSEAGRWPNLASYWTGFRSFEPGLLMRMSAALRRFARAREPMPIGSGRLLPDGALHLELTAVSRSGAVGHGQMVLPADSPSHADVLVQRDPTYRDPAGRRRQDAEDPFVVWPLARR